jgi:hypothetical protein
MPEVKEAMGKVRCIRHPKSDWYFVPFDNSNERHNRARKRGISEMLCSDCLVAAKYNSENNEPSMP